MPTKGEFVDIVNNYYKNSVYYQYQINYTNNRVSDSLMPKVGYRNINNAAVGSMDIGYYWSSTPYSTHYAYLLISYGLDPQYSSNVAQGFSVRCFKDFPNQLLTIDANG